MKHKLILLFVILFSFNSFAQKTTTIDNQFKKTYKKSESYLEFKLIPKKEYAAIHDNVLDSIKNYKNLISSKDALITSKDKTIAILTKEKKDTTTKLNEAISKNTSASIFGIALSHST